MKNRPNDRFRAAAAPEALKAIAGDLPLDVLIAAGIVSTSGAAGADAARKVKQIKHFVQLVRPALDDVFARHPEPVLVDAGAGRSALSLVIHHLWPQRLGRGTTIAVESRPELCARVEGACAALHFDRFAVLPQPIAVAAVPDRVHFVLALHACDTATDDALLLALRTNADHVAAVPCCQAEVARQLAAIAAPGPVGPLWQHAHHRREFGAHITNVIRALQLQACGYQVTVTELAGWEHTPKNELILGRRVGRFHRGAQTALADLLAQIPVEPTLVRGLAAQSSSGTGGTPGPSSSTSSDDSGSAIDTEP